VTRRSLARLVAGLVTGLSLLAATACVPTAKKQPPTVVVYGDSLTVQSVVAAQFLYRSVNQNVVFRAGIGTAMCDWLNQAAEDKVALHPQRVILAFTGNTLTDCISKAFTTGGPRAAIAVYEQSLRQMRATFPTAEMTIVIPPAADYVDHPDRFNGNPDLVAMYEKVGPQLHMAINPDADNWLTPHHIFVPKRPQFPNGPLVTVRDADGLHLTPAGEDWYGAALLEVKPVAPLPTQTPTPTRIPTPTPTPSPVSSTPSATPPATPPATPSPSPSG
jgi:hypothetical protein